MDLFLFTPLVAPNKEVETEGSEIWVLAGTGCFQRETGNHWEISPPVGAKTRQAEKGRLRHHLLCTHHLSGRTVGQAQSTEELTAAKWKKIKISFAPKNQDNPS